MSRKTDQTFDLQAFDENKKLSEEPFIKKEDQQKIEWDLIIPKVLFLGKKENTEQIIEYLMKAVPKGTGHHVFIDSSG